MSGGFFDYVQFQIDRVADQVESYIQRCEFEDQEAGNRHLQYATETMARFRECEQTLRRASAMLQRMDCLLSGDDTEVMFHQRWDKEIPAVQPGAPEQCQYNAADTIFSLTRCCWKHWNALVSGLAVEDALPLRLSRDFIACSICGNKRCQKASDCELECTNSNDPGQETPLEPLSDCDSM